MFGKPIFLIHVGADAASFPDACFINFVPEYFWPIIGIIRPKSLKQPIQHMWLMPICVVGQSQNPVGDAAYGEFKNTAGVNV
jgi:hypothetical protein